MLKHKVVIFILTTIAIGLIIGGFFCPPLGAIDGSILTAVGEIFGFASLWVVIKAIEERYDVKLKKGDTELTIGNDDGEL